MKIKGSKIFLFVLLCLINGANIAASKEAEITESNWIDHPEIKEIREIYSAIEADIKSINIIEHKKIYEYEEPYKPVLKAIYVNKNNVARKYVEEASSDDSALSLSYYYENKILRFVFIKGGAVNGSHMEHRIYFNSKGKRIWEIQKYLVGPGYSFPTVWPDNQLVFEPWEEFNREN